MLAPFERCTVAHKQCSAHHVWVVQSYREARELWELQSDVDTRGWSAELSQYRNPPTFRDWLVTQAQSWYADTVNKPVDP